MVRPLPRKVDEEHPKHKIGPLYHGVKSGDSVARIVSCGMLVRGTRQLDNKISLNAAPNFDDALWYADKEAPFAVVCELRCHTSRRSKTNKKYYTLKEHWAELVALHFVWTGREAHGDRLTSESMFFHKGALHEELGNAHKQLSMNEPCFDTWGDLPANFFGDRCEAYQWGKKLTWF